MSKKKYGMDLPATLERSPDEAQRTFAKTGPSDPQAGKSGKDARKGRAETFGGVDVQGNTRRELYERAKDLGIPGRSSMDKQELARAIAKKQ